MTRLPVCLGLLLPAVVAGAETPRVEEAAAAEPIEEVVEGAGDHYWALADSLEQLALAQREQGADEIVLLEAEEMAAIAEEFLLEGDPETANELLVAAIALLEPEGKE